MEHFYFFMIRYLCNFSLVNERACISIAIDAFLVDIKVVFLFFVLFIQLFFCFHAIHEANTRSISNSLRLKLSSSMGRLFHLVEFANVKILLKYSLSQNLAHLFFKNFQGTESAYNINVLF